MISVLKQRIFKHYFRARFKNRVRYKANLDNLYFAYGANLSIDRFDRLNMSAESLSTAFIDNHQLDFSLATEYLNKGYAGISPHLGKRVYGQVFKIDSESLKYLDVLEWCGFGAYKREEKEIIVNNKKVKAWVYTAKTPDFNRMPSCQYKNFILNTSRKLNFPEEYITHIESHECSDSFDIDHYFSLRTYSRSRLQNKYLHLIYKVHDYIREYISNKI